MTEDDIEQLAIAWFQESGWDFRNGSDIAPDRDTRARSDWRQVVLAEELAAALAQLNPGVPAGGLDEALQAATRPDSLRCCRTTAGSTNCCATAFLSKWQTPKA